MDRVMLAGDALILVGVIINASVLLIAGAVLVIVGFARTWWRRSHRR